ncbi:hypothetical protein ACXIUT_27780 [Achromobacter denitrificans]
MSVTPNDMLQTGHKALGMADCEADYRNAVGRFYYAAHHHVKDFHNALPSPGRNTSKHGSHDELCSQLVNPTIPKDSPDYTKSRQLGIMAKALLTHRIKADYWVATHEVFRADAEEAQHLASRLIAL